MKTINLLQTFVLFLNLSTFAIAQNKCCSISTVAPEINTTTSGTSIDLNQMTVTPTLTVNASPDLPNVEYIITKKGVAALDSQGQPSSIGGGGDVIIGTDVDGVFIPANQTRYNIALAAGDMFDVMAIGYDLALIQELTDSLLNGSNGNGQPCCNMFSLMAIVLSEPALAGFCDTLNNAGIYSGADVTSFEDVLTVFSPFVEDQFSVEAIVYVFDLINGNGTYISPECGGTASNDFVPYGLNGGERYAYHATTTVLANTCCSSATVAPELNPGLHGTLIATNENTPSLVLAVNASPDLPTVEYLITKRNEAALDALGQPDTTQGGGDVVIGADEDGIFMPMDKTRHGVTLVVGDTFDITAIGYDLSVWQTLVDSILNGMQNGQPCCDLFSLLATASNKPYLAGFCDSIANLGISGAGDLNNMEELLPIFEELNNTQISLNSLVATFELLNNNGTYISPDCGGTGSNNFIPYGIHLEKQYAYVVDNPLVVEKLSEVSLFMLYPNPANTDALNVYFTTKEVVDLTINLFDALGQRVHSQVLGNVSGDFNTTIPVHNLASGMYYVELTDGRNNQLLKVIVE